MYVSHITHCIYRTVTHRSPDCSVFRPQQYGTMNKLVISVLLSHLQPSWTLYIQVMTFEQAERFRWNPFDLTKVLHRAYFLLFTARATLDVIGGDYS